MSAAAAAGGCVGCAGTAVGCAGTAVGCAAGACVGGACVGAAVGVAHAAITSVRASSNMPNAKNFLDCIILLLQRNLKFELFTRLVRCRAQSFGYISIVRAATSLSGRCDSKNEIPRVTNSIIKRNGARGICNYRTVQHNCISKSSSG
ncbi:hypothetical protein FBQ82_10410 [Anaerolineae bacterium CFX7]|nr:hypothetical protein [Anaerolineae bacterium CFX7]